ncbi:type III-B CRISPR module RAMP protein Cmr1 [Thermococcus sp.]
MEISLKTLTPLWSGNAKRECIKLREVSILGSLRWWFEVIVRGVNGHACDSTSENKCEYKGNIEKICHVCQLFGTTGWAKRFRIDIDGKFWEPYSGKLVIMGQQRSWHYEPGLISDSISIKLQPIFPLFIDPGDSNKEILDSIMGVLLRFISNWGMVGGKTAIGYGVVKAETNIRNSDFEIFKSFLDVKKNSRANASGAPRLDEMFFARFKVNEAVFLK